MRMYLAAASALCFFILSKATRQAIGTEAVSSPRKNIRKLPLETMINIPKSVEITSIQNSPSFFRASFLSQGSAIISTITVPALRITFMTLAIAEATYIPPKASAGSDSKAIRTGRTAIRPTVIPKRMLCLSSRRCKKKSPKNTTNKIHTR